MAPASPTILPAESTKASYSIPPSRHMPDNVQMFPTWPPPSGLRQPPEHTLRFALVPQ